MKRLFTLFAFLGILSGAHMMAQNFPDDPGTLMVRLDLSAIDQETNDTIPGGAPEGAGSYEAGTELSIIPKTIAGYTFLMWSDQTTDNPKNFTINESMSLDAIYSHDTYLITFKNDNGETISSERYHYGDEVTEPEAPVKESTDQYSYEFKGWNPEVTEVTGETTYTAVWDTIINRYPVVFLDWDEETVLYRDTLPFGSTPVYGGPNPTRETTEGTVYTWIGWEPDIHAVVSSEDGNRYVANYSDQLLEFTVTIVLGSSEPTTQIVEWGNEIELSAPDNAEQHFIRWTDGSEEQNRVVVITSDTTFTAIYGASYVDINVTANQWTFFCLPPLSLADGWSEQMFITSELQGVAWGTYNGAVRAEGRSGWEVPEIFQEQQGYIIYSTNSGRLRLNVYPENLRTSDVSTGLVAYTAEFPDNANWNFVGNPFYSELPGSAISISGEGMSEASATVWNGTGYTNEPISGTTFQPLQAFFIQTAGEGSLAFNNNGNPAPARAQQVEENSRIDINATAGGYTDKTRVIFRSNSSLKYEAGRDASKFMTATAPIQMYFLDVDNIQCAQMVRPAGDDNMRIGYMLRNAGGIELNMPYYADSYELYDALTDRSYDLSETISIYSEAGTFNDRLQLRPIRTLVTAIDSNAVSSQITKIMLNGQLYIVRDGKMFSVQGREVR